MIEKEFGVNVIGFINGEFGLGEAVRLLIKAMKSANIPVSLINYGVETSLQHEDKTFENFTTEAPYSINLVLLGLTDLKNVFAHFSETNIFENKYNIYFLNWESENFPDEYLKEIRLFDEIWVPAQYCKNVISRYVTVPVNIIHYPIDIKINDSDDLIATSFYNSESFNFLFLFDFNSSFVRKNPLNLIEAFNRAFKDDKTVSLTIKASGSKRFPKEKEELLKKIEGCENIKIVEKIFEKNTLHKIINGCDCYISLHRSEGFGLTMAEAMYYGKPVIATGYSGNLDFMNNQNSFLVDYDISKIDKVTINYDENTIWSTPNIDHAASLMKNVRTNSILVQQIAQKGKETIMTDFSVQKIGIQIKERVVFLVENLKIDGLKNDFIFIVSENRKNSEELRIYRKSKIIALIYAVKLFFRNRKKKNRK